jgi:hypothetical protein
MGRRIRGGLRGRVVFFSLQLALACCLVRPSDRFLSAHRRRFSRRHSFLSAAVGSSLQIRVFHGQPGPYFLSRSACVHVAEGMVTSFCPVRMPRDKLFRRLFFRQSNS